MSAKFEDDKFVVIPTKYIVDLPTTARIQLRYILHQVGRLREAAGKTDLDPKYYVVNRDEPYADEVLGTILLGEKHKGKKNA